MKSMISMIFYGSIALQINLANHFWLANFGLPSPQDPQALSRASVRACVWAASANLRTTDLWRNAWHVYIIQRFDQSWLIMIYVYIMSDNHDQYTLIMFLNLLENWCPSPPNCRCLLHCAGEDFLQRCERYTGANTEDRETAIWHLMYLDKFASSLTEDLCALLLDPHQEYSSRDLIGCASCPTAMAGSSKLPQHSRSELNFDFKCFQRL